MMIFYDHKLMYCFTFLTLRLLQAEEKQKSAYQEKETLEMRYQDEIDLAKVDLTGFYPRAMCVNDYCVIIDIRGGYVLGGFHRPPFQQIYIFNEIHNYYKNKSMKLHSQKS